MKPEDRKAQIEIQQFLIDNPWASGWDAENHRAHRLSGGRLPDPTKSEQFAVKKAKWEHRNGKTK